jgi:hypothetical protein
MTGLCFSSDGSVTACLKVTTAPAMSCPPAVRCQRTLILVREPDLPCLLRRNTSSEILGRDASDNLESSHKDSNFFRAALSAVGAIGIEASRSACAGDTWQTGNAVIVNGLTSWPQHCDNR